LEFLANYQQRVVSQVEILEHVWDIHFNLDTNDNNWLENAEKGKPAFSLL
jgi:DNA-binding response OmpR family regulator